MEEVNDPVLDRDKSAESAMVGPYTGYVLVTLTHVETLILIIELSVIGIVDVASVILSRVRLFSAKTLAAGEKAQVEKGKFVKRHRRSLLAELSASDPPRPILTPEELAWVSDAMGGAELSTPKVLYDMDDDPKRSATIWLDSCARHTLKGGREMLVVVVELNTGKKVVGTTEVGWNSAKPGHRDDHHAALYEVTGKHVWRVGAKYPNAIEIKNGPLSYHAAAFGLMGMDFHLDNHLSTAPQHSGSCRPGRWGLLHGLRLTSLALVCETKCSCVMCGGLCNEYDLNSLYISPNTTCGHY